MIIKNAEVLTDDFKFKKTDLRFEDGKITEIGDDLSGDEIIEGTGKYLTPGFIDIHTHGCVGFDGCDADIDGYEKMTEFYASKGVTSFLFTTMTLSEDELVNIMKSINEFMNSGKGASYAHGIYLEGPFINVEKKGAQAGEYVIPPTMEVFRKFNEASGNRIKVCVVAPEVEGGLDFIKEVSKECAVSIGHTCSDYETAVKSMENGSTDITHFFNAMPPFNHRNPAVIGAAFDGTTHMELICDGIHLHPAIIRTVFKAAGDDRPILISDSMRAAGMPDGPSSLGGQEVFVKDGKATLADGTIAGSASNVHSCVYNCIKKFGIPAESAFKAATINPAKLIGAYEVTGSLTVGKNADMILMDKEDLSIVSVFVKGKKVK